MSDSPSSASAASVSASTPSVPTAPSAPLAPAPGRARDGVYAPGRIEPKWQAYWAEHQTFRSPELPTGPKKYVLDMFPYPSGDGLHVGHPRGYTATDTLCRYWRMKGFSVLHPMGWDSFGLPAEEHARKTGEHPGIVTRRNIARFKSQLQRLGLSYDWSREISTCEPDYYKWTQWIFTQLLNKGLAYESEMLVNWCEALGTVLADEEVVNGRSERGDHPVVRRPLKQWVLKITAYAERLIDDLEGLDWPESIKKQQRHWIGKSEGARVRFEVAVHPGLSFEVFTTRPDTLFGATYCVLAPEHPLVDTLTTAERRAEIDAYRARTARKSDMQRTEVNKEKTGAFTGAYAVNPANGEHVPIWIADYVLMTYGTGAIMAVPAHDERDLEFARAFGLPVRVVVRPPESAGGMEAAEGFTGDGVAVHSGFLNDLPTPQAKRTMIDWLQKTGHGIGQVSYRLRDWLFSRQRYWGEPVPVYKYPDGTLRAFDVDELPLLLPETTEYAPRPGEAPGPGEAIVTPLSRIPGWTRTTDPKTGREALRDPNTMPQWAGSCWYYLRFIDPHNTQAAFDPAKVAAWGPVDLYVGGAEHAVLHLLYARFWHKVLYDLGLVPTKEPFQKLVNQGMILGETFYDRPRDDDNRRRVSRDRVEWRAGKPFDKETGSVVWPEVEKMSKSLGNVVNPDDTIERYGADALRMYEMFMGPIDQYTPWTDEGIQGVYRFLGRFWRLLAACDEAGADIPSPRVAGDAYPSAEFERITHETIKKVGEDLDHMRFNTAISQLMIWTNAAYEAPFVPPSAAHALIRTIAPFAPHVAEELWSLHGFGESLAYAPWPAHDEAKLARAEVKVAVQVNGKVRAELLLPADIDAAAALAAALADAAVQKWIDGKPLKFSRYVPGKMVTLAV